MTVDSYTLTVSCFNICDGTARIRQSSKTRIFLALFKLILSLLVDKPEDQYHLLLPCGSATPGVFEPAKTQLLLLQEVLINANRHHFVQK